jgi:elongation factor P
VFGHYATQQGKGEIMVASNQISPGMTISINKKLYRVESSVKVTVPKGTPFIKSKLRELSTNKVVEKNFNLNQEIQDVALDERDLEYLYIEGKDFLFLDFKNLDQILVPATVVGDNTNYLKEGTVVKASFFGESPFSVELPQFLELMVSSDESHGKDSGIMANATKTIVLETGAKVEVPPFIEVGDIIKIDTKTNEYIQRV